MNSPDPTAAYSNDGTANLVLAQALPSGAIVDQYMVERVLAHGGFSIVYLARQIKDQYQVVIKEYMPTRYAQRDGHKVITPNPQQATLFKRGRQFFLDEARTLSKLKHPNIVEVLNFFLCNDTAYLVMNYDYGNILGDVLKQPDHLPSTNWILDVFPPLMRSLKIMHHRGLLHLDIKPDNIMLRPNNNPLLLDFGAAVPFQNDPTTCSHTLTHGFSSPEQYDKNARLLPYSDVYALGATLRASLDRKAPPTAQKRHTEDRLIPATEAYQGRYPEQLLQAIDWSMCMDPSKRPQSMDDFLRPLLYL